MSICVEDVRFTAACVASLAVGCLSTGEPLFREEFASAAPAREMTSMQQPSAAIPDEPAAMPSAMAPEQLLGGDRDRVPIVPDEASEAGEPAQAAVPPEAPPATVAVETDPCAIEDAILCETFEDMSEDAFPRSEAWLPELAGCAASHVIDAAGPSASGTKALRADDGGYPECMLHAKLSGEDDIYVRTSVFLGDSDLLAEYVSLLEFGSRAAQDDPELRIGVRPVLDAVCPGVPGIDVTGSGLVRGTATACTGVVLEPERWYCIGAHFVRAGANLTLSVSLDGAELLTRDFAGTPAWADDDLYVKLGRASYGASSSGSVWHDDVAVSRHPIPCDL
jgi:hypothetical protein